MKRILCVAVLRGKAKQFKMQNLYDGKKQPLKLPSILAAKSAAFRLAKFGGGRQEEQLGR